MDPRRLLELFVGESREHLGAAAQLLEPWEEGATPLPASAELMRHAHSLKGMAMSMGFSSMEALAHALEDLFDAGPPADPSARREALALAREALACIGAIVDRAERGEERPEDPRSVRIAEELRGAGASKPGGDLPIALRGSTHAEGASEDGDDGEERWKIELLQYGASRPDAAKTVSVLRRLGALGEVEQVNPPLQAGETGRFEGRLVLVLRGPVGRDRLERELREMPEVACYNVQSLPTSLSGETAAQRPVGWARVRADLLDKVLEKALDLLHQHRKVRASAAGGEEELQRRLERSGFLLKESYALLTELRLVPFESALQALDKTVRELSRELGKPARLEVEGGSIQVDRSVLDALTDPLRHMIRNALDHGIEAGEERAAAGKPAEAILALRIERRGEWLRVSLEDDGRGLDAAALKRTALERGLLSSEAAERLSDAEVFLLSTLPSLSTASSTSRISGRGVGMDVVRRNIERLGGRLTLRSEPGRWTRIDLAVPLTLALIEALLLRCGGETFAVPVTRVKSGLGWTEPAGDPPRSTKNGSGAGIETLRLASLLGLPDPEETRSDETALLLEAEEGRVALIVEEVLGRRELLVRPLGPPLNELRAYSGAALLEDGSIALVLDPDQLAATGSIAERADRSR